MLEELLRKRHSISDSFRELFPEIGDDDRLTYKMFYLNNMGRFLFGGTHLRSELGHYAHDLLLDGYDIGGIFTLAALCFLLDIFC